MKDFPGGPVVENLPAKTGDMGTIPGLGRFHMPRGNWACAPEPESDSSEPQVLRVRGSATRKATALEAGAPQPESRPSSLQLEKAQAQQRRPSPAKTT